MNKKFSTLFTEYLVNTCKYPSESIRTNIYKYDCNVYERVEIINDGAIIQAFVLMSPTHVEQIDKFPFYRTYYQRNEYGTIVTPACNVAVYIKESDTWIIHSPKDLKHELTSPDLLNYDKAVDRFRKRFNQIGNEKLAHILIRTSIGAIIIIALYFIAYVLSENELLFGFVIPMNSYVVSIITILLILVIVPPLIPYIKSIGYKDYGVEFK